MLNKCTAYYPKEILTTYSDDLNVFDHAEASLQRPNWYVNKADLF